MTIFYRDESVIAKNVFLVELLCNWRISNIDTPSFILHY